MLFNHGTTRRKGVMILLNPKLNYKIEKISQNKNGRFILAKLIIEDTHFISVNVYSPNDANQQVLFFSFQSLALFSGSFLFNLWLVHCFHPY